MVRESRSCKDIQERGIELIWSFCDEVRSNCCCCLSPGFFYVTVGRVIVKFPSTVLPIRWAFAAPQSLATRISECCLDFYRQVHYPLLGGSQKLPPECCMRNSEIHLVQLPALTPLLQLPRKPLIKTGMSGYRI